MCEFEEYLFVCGCSKKALMTYCHLARNDPNHQCFGVKRLRNVWNQHTLCQNCTAAKAAQYANFEQPAYGYAWAQQPPAQAFSN